MRYANQTLQDNGLAYLSANCDKVLLLKDFTTLYSLANGSAKLAECALVSGDFALSGGLVTGTATGGAASTLTDTSKTWTVNALTGLVIEITSGTGVGQYRTIASNTANQVTTTSPWTTQPDAGSVYAIPTPRSITATLTGKSAGNALAALADGSNMHLAFVKTGTSEVILVTEESSNQAIVSGAPVTLNSNPVYSLQQPTA